jgi:hypothetical protein
MVSKRSDELQGSKDMSLLPWYFCWWHAESSLSATNYEERDNPNVPKTTEIVVASIAKLLSSSVKEPWWY